MDRITAAHVFVTIVDRGSLIAAADTLEMSRAMVTRYLAEMEEWAGTRLLHRTTRRQSLTTAGEDAYTRCRQMLDIAGQMAVADGPDGDTPRGLLRISCSQSIGQSVLAAAISGYLQRYPAAAVDLQISNRAVNLVDERIDLAIRISNDLDPNLIARSLGTCDSVVCAAPAYLATHGTPQRAEDLAMHNCLTYSYFGKSIWHFEVDGDNLTVPVNGNLSANESVVLLSAAAAGAGITLQPVFSAAPLIADGTLVALLPAYRPMTMGIWGIYTSRKQMPATLRTMLDFLIDYFNSDQAWSGYAAGST